MATTSELSDGDLTPETVAAALPDRSLRVYPAMLSTESDALAWARAGGPDGAVVVADYQASPRGRSGWEWRVHPGHGLGFSLVIRPALPVRREGWPYLAASLGLADLRGPAAVLRWPDSMHLDGRRAAAVGIHVEPGLEAVAWATVTVLIDDALPPRAPLLAAAITAIERRLSQEAVVVLTDYRARCATLGRRVSARLIPMGPSGVVVKGTAVDCRDDGSLVIAVAEGRRVAVPPQHLGILDVHDEAEAG